MSEITFPAVLIASRGSHNLTPPVLAFADGVTLETDKELERRLTALRNLDATAAMCGGVVYSYTLSPVNEVSATIERIRSELTAALGLQDPEPEPATTTDPDYLQAAIDAAAAAFADNPAVLSRLSRAAELVRAGAVVDLGAGQWAVTGSTGTVYHVNGDCNCKDCQNGAPVVAGRKICKHRLAVLLVRKTAELQKDGAKGADTPKAPDAPTGEDTTQAHDTPANAPSQIDLIVNYETDAARTFTRLHTGGELEQFTVDGTPAEPPTRDLSELYRWLQDREYMPAGFVWLDKGQGGRRRRQTYTRAA